ncbi:hypothetical protein Dimus_024100 [Dionaea muscipula]
MGYVISVENDELPYGDWLIMVFEAYNLRRIEGIWWLGTGENRRRDDEDEAQAENVQNEEVANEGQNNQEDFDWDAVIDEVEIQREEMEKEAKIQGESGSDDKFFDAEVGVEEPADEVPEVPAFPTSPADSSNVQQKQNAAGVDPSVSTAAIPDSTLRRL